MSEEHMYVAEGYDHYSFQERFPGLHALGMGLVIGTLAAIATSSAIALSQFAAGAPWKELLALWGMTIVLMVPTFATAFGAGFLAHHYRRLVPDEQSQRALVGGTPIDTSGIIATDIGIGTLRAPASVSETVVQNANDQAFLHYELGREPTRRHMEKSGVSQTVWNSGRHILTTAKIVEGKEWAPESLEVIERVLDNIRAEHDRVWIRPLGERTMICLHINKQAVNKRYTRPTLPAWEPEYNQGQAGSVGSGN